MNIVQLLFDGTEILCISTIIYYCLLWLKKDSTGKLLRSFYAVCGFIIFIWIVPLPTLTALTITLWPLGAMLFIIFHQDTLQRNMVCAKRLIPSHHDEKNPAQLLCGSLFTLLNKGKSIYCLLELENKLDSYITSSSLLHCPLQSDVLHLIYESSHYNADQFLWIRYPQTIVGFNGAIITNHIPLTLEQGEHEPSWIQDAVLLTAKTDACIFKSDATLRTFTLVIKGTIIPHLSPTQLYNLLNKTLSIHQKRSGDITYEHFYKKDSQQHYHT